MHLHIKVYIYANAFMKRASAKKFYFHAQDWREKKKQKKSKKKKSGISTSNKD
jgi:hypothetical protein